MFIGKYFIFLNAIIFSFTLHAMDAPVDTIRKISDGLYVSSALHQATGDRLYFALERVSSCDDVKKWRAFQTFAAESKKHIEKSDDYPFLKMKVNAPVNRAQILEAYLLREQLTKLFAEADVYIAYTKNVEIKEKLPAFPNRFRLENYTEALLKSHAANGIEMAVGVVSAPNMFVQSHVGIARATTVPRDKLTDERSYFHGNIANVLHGFIAAAVNVVAQEKGDLHKDFMVTVPASQMDTILARDGGDKQQRFRWSDGIFGEESWLAQLDRSWFRTNWGMNLSDMASNGECPWVIARTADLASVFMTK